MKKKPLLLILLAHSPLLLLAQPANDDCDGAIQLGQAPACADALFFSNINATPSDIGGGNIPACFDGGSAQRDVWFSFTSSDTIFDYAIAVAGAAFGASPAMINPQFALYRGDCSGNNLLELACASAEAGAETAALSVEGLAPGATYFLRISDYSPPPGPNGGSFQICIEEKKQDYLINEGGSTSCYGRLYDTGGPDGDYGNNESHIFTICPEQAHDCILFTLDYYFIEPQGQFGAADLLTFFDGDQPNPANIIGQVGSFNFPDDGGGGICYQVKASSGCLTVSFTSDNQLAFEGFRGHWQCTADCETILPIAVDSNISNQQIIDFVSTPNVSAAITNISCPPSAYGTFEAEANSGLGLERGLLLASGSLAWAAGPNTDHGQGNPNADNGAPGDPDLDYLSQLSGNDYSSVNACIVELDVFAATNELSFEYVFGSEEYQEYVGREFNDIFAFFISGPGIAGDPNINNQLNIAVLPNGSNTPVEINSVNHLTNWEYYRNNNNGLAIQYDGLTSDFMGAKKSLTARAGVQPCNTYHLKLAIADRGDAGFDSGVFISELGGGTARLSVEFNSGIDYLAENCSNLPDELIVSLTASSDDTLSYRVEVGGTASRNVDYVLDIPSAVTFLPGQTSHSFPLVVLSDLETEPTETITIRLANNFGCGDITYDELTINLADELRVEINAGQDTAYICRDNTARLQAAGAASYFWAPAGIFDNPTLANPEADPDADLWVTVEGTLGPCVAYDSIFLQRTTAALAVVSSDPAVICRGDSVRLHAQNNVAGMGLQWAPAAGLDDWNSEHPLARPQETTTYVATLNLNGCLFQDSITIDVAVFEFPNVNADTAICENEGVQLANPISADSTTTLFQWVPASSLDNAAIAGPLAFPDSTTTYRLVATAANGACADTAEIRIDVIEPPVLSFGPQDTAICPGGSVRLSASATGGSPGGQFFWSGADGSSREGPSVVFEPAGPLTYTLAFVSESGCDTLAGSLEVAVHPPIAASLETSLPDPGNAQQGSPISLNALAGQPPPLDFTWALNGAVVQQGPGLSSYDDILIADPSVYTVFIQNPATGCRDSASLAVNVHPFRIELPNAFTPNGDGHNDFFTYIAAGNIRNILEFKVFNRWGQLVFDAPSSPPGSFMGWDGTFRGQPQPSEVYFYLLRLERYDKVVVEKRGEVSLLR